jgi:hypothetical protein
MILLPLSVLSLLTQRFHFYCIHLSESEAESIREFCPPHSVILSTLFTIMSTMTAARADMSVADKYVCNGCEIRTGEKTTRESTTSSAVWAKQSKRCFDVINDPYPLPLVEFVHLGVMSFLACLQSRRALWPAKVVGVGSLSRHVGEARRCRCTFLYMP